jgi:hypothetical protein
VVEAREIGVTRDAEVLGQAPRGHPQIPTGRNERAPHWISLGVARL